jgi:hypothetical protein
VLERAGEMLAESPADHYSVAHVVAGLPFHVLYRRTRPGERSPPRIPAHPG